MFGMKAAAQYVLPASNIKSVYYPTTAEGGASVNPIFDGTNYIIWDDMQEDLMKASPFITSGFTDVYTSGLGNTTSRNNSLTYENGRYFFTDFGAGDLYTFTSLGGPITKAIDEISNEGPRIVKWYAAANCWVAVGNAGNYWTSINGTTWTRNDFTDGSNVSALSTNGTILIAAGSSGVMYTTTSTSLPLTWTARTSSFGTSNIFAIHYKSVATSLAPATYQDYWVATGAIGKVAYSTNGTTWTQATTGAPIDQTIYGITYHMGRWVIVTEGSPDTRAYVIRSNTKLPSGTWTVVSTSEPPEGVSSDQQIGKIFSDGKYIFWHPDVSSDSQTTVRVRYCR